MTLNLNLEDVPDAILESVMARILRNRRNLKDNQQQIQRPLLQPKPQVRNQGANNRTWKKPEPAAILDSGGETVGVVWFCDQWHGGLPNMRPTESPFSLFLPDFSSSDIYRFRIGSGDGSTWIDDVIETPGASSWRSQILDELESVRNSFQYPDEFDNYFIDNGFLPRPVSTTKVIYYDDFSITPIPIGEGKALCIVHAQRARSFSGVWSKPIFQEADEGFFTDYQSITFEGEKPYPRIAISFQTGVHPNITMSSSGFKLYVVSQTACKQVQSPSTFTEVINKLFPPIEWSASKVWTYNSKFIFQDKFGYPPLRDPESEPEPVSIAIPGPTDDLIAFETQNYTVRKPVDSSKTPRLPFASYRIPTGDLYPPANGNVTFTAIDEQQSSFGPVSRLADFFADPVGTIGFNPSLIDVDDIIIDNSIVDSYFEANLLRSTTSPAIFSFFKNTAAVNSWIRSTYPNDEFFLISSNREFLQSIEIKAPSRTMTIDYRSEPFKSLYADSFGAFISDPLYDLPSSVKSIPYAYYLSPLQYSFDRIPIENFESDPPLASLQSAGRIPFSTTRANPFDGLPADEGYPFRVYPVFYTDWGRPGFCKQQLLALGFSAADLQP